MLKVFLQVVLRIKEETEVFWLKMFGKLKKSVKNNMPTICTYQALLWLKICKTKRRFYKTDVSVTNMSVIQVEYV